MSACVYLVFHGRHLPNGLFALMAYIFEFLDVSCVGDSVLCVGVSEIVDADITHDHNHFVSRASDLLKSTPLVIVSSHFNESNDVRMRSYLLYCISYLFHYYVYGRSIARNPFICHFSKYSLIQDKVIAIRGGSNIFYGHDIQHQSVIHNSSSPYTKSPETGSSPSRLSKTVLNLESIAAALRLTCEINRKLDRVQCFGKTPSGYKIVDDTLLPKVDPNTGRTIPRLPFPTISQQKYKQMHPRTIFHAKAPQSQRTTELFLQHLVQACDITLPDLSTQSQMPYNLELKSHPMHEQVVIFSMALIYLDRSCSVETLREPIQITQHLIHDMPFTPTDPFGQNEHYQSPLMSSRIASVIPSACPYIMPQTMHNLVITAVILACRMVRSQQLPHPPPPSLWSWWDCYMNDEENESPLDLEDVVDEVTKQYALRLQQSGIPIDALTLYRMQIAMMGALGSGVGGLHVDSSVLLQFIRRWKQMFGGEIPVSTNLFSVGPDNNQPPFHRVDNDEQYKATVMITETITTDSNHYFQSSTTIAREIPVRIKENGDVDNINDVVTRP
jgi:hypothetical protein